MTGLSRGQGMDSSGGISMALPYFLWASVRVPLAGFPASAVRLELELESVFWATQGSNAAGALPPMAPAGT